MSFSKILLPLTLFFIFSLKLDAQYFLRQLTDLKGTPLPEAMVVWTGTTIGSSTDANGEFALLLPADTRVMPLRLTAMYGVVRDTFLIDDVHSYWTLEMSAEVALKEVTIQDVQTGAYVSVLQPIKTEIINRDELRKAAYCDLAGCFETQSTVQPTTTNVLTNARELRILGLSGVHNQVLVDGLPTIQGLTYTYGTSMFTGKWTVKKCCCHSIQDTKF